MAGIRVRVYQFLKLLNNTDINYKVIPGSTKNLDEKIVRFPSLINKFLWFSYTLLSRFIVLFSVRKYDVVFLQRESLPNVFPLIEILITTISKKVVFDFDDAIYTAHRPSGFIRKIFFDSKNIERIIKRSDRTIVSNKYLAQYAAKFNDDIKY